MKKSDNMAMNIIKISQKIKKIKMVEYRKKYKMRKLGKNRNFFRGKFSGLWSEGLPGSP